jgi:hypothetical protein
MKLTALAAAIALTLSGGLIAGCEQQGGGKAGSSASGGTAPSGAGGTAPSAPEKKPASPGGTPPSGK